MMEPEFGSTAYLLKEMEKEPYESVFIYCAPVTKDEFKLNHHDDIAFVIT